MLFTTDQFYKRVYKEIRRKPRAVEIYDSLNAVYKFDGDKPVPSNFLHQHTQLQLYIGAIKDFDDPLHFYFQTLREQIETQGDDWRTG